MHERGVTISRSKLSYATAPGRHPTRGPPSRYIQIALNAGLTDHIEGETARP